MDYKKMLVVILVTIVAMFGLMLTTSYAWYSFEKGWTNFTAVTNNDDIEVSFLRGEYINQTVGVPIKSTDVDKYSDKHQFTIKTKDNVEDNEIMVSISLVDITMNSSLWVDAFKVELYYQGSLLEGYSGEDQFTGGGATTFQLANVVLDNDVDNQFELRVYLLDDDTDQEGLMNKSFQAKIEVNVVSRLKTTLTTWDTPDIYISSVTVDGTTLDTPTIPSDGYYSMSASCEKGSSLSWDGYSKTITYASGSYVNDSCALTFTSSTDYMYLNEVEPGSYVEYIGTNGCDGRHCEGENANYESDLKMGYCSNSYYQFTVNGWRVGYILDGSAYLISAGALECVRTYVDYETTSTTSVSAWTSSYYYGSGYTFDDSTGNFTLTGVTDSVLAWSTDYESIIANTPYTCKKSSATATCTTMYEVASTSTSATVKYYIHYNYSGNVLKDHIPHLNQVALTYCNKEYAKGGVCDDTTAWAMKDADYNNIIGKTLSSCSSKYSDKTCGYTNDLIDNGGYYWFATKFSSTKTFYWYPDNRYVNNISSNRLYGVRPVLYLESSVLVVGGSGTYEDPYQISSGS